MEDDEYWNTSETKAKAFSFDDDVLFSQEILSFGQKVSSPPTQSDNDNIFGSGVSKQPLLPLSSIVSNKNLNMILLAHSGKQLPGVKGLNAEVETVSTTLKRLVLGRPCSLHCHKSLKNKTELLNGAILLGDGNVILAVVLFCVQTLNKSIVYELLSSRPVALNHYVDFLMSENKSSELMDLLTMLGRIPAAAMKTYQLLMTSSWNNPDAMLNKLKRLQTNHFSQSEIDAHQVKMVSDYIKLLEWQHCVGTADVRGLSVLQCLAYCCANNWNDGAGKILSPLTLCQQHQIMPIQYDWIALTVHGTLKNWEIVENLFTKKDWLGRSTVSSNIPLTKIVLHLHTLGASSNVLATYIQQISNLEQRLEIAKQYKVHSVVIEVYAKQRDRDALTNYKMTLNAQSEEYFLAENTLRDKNIKWKN